MSRRWWTMRELKEARFYADEGLSIARTAALIGRTRDALGAAAARYGIQFAGEPGAPFGNSNRSLSGVRLTHEQRRRRNTERMRRWRRQQRVAEAAD